MRNDSQCSFPFTYAKVHTRRFCNKHLWSNQLLDGAKQPSLGRQQVDDFLKGIKNEKIIALKAQILADPIA